jgi:myo-inositol-1(or 4)-monophosphatase
MLPTTFPAHLRDVIAIAGEAASLVLEHAGRAERLTKRNDEAVTEVDRASQRLIVARLRALFPGDGMVGEESDDGSGITCHTPDPAGRVWVIDPIDGTNNFVAGYGAFAICIGLLEAGRPVLGVVHDITRGWTYAAAQGAGAWLWDGRSARRIAATPAGFGPASLLMLTSNLLDAQGQLPQWAGRVLTIKPWKVRMLGSAALEAVQVAAGCAHGAITLNGKLWDVAAAAAVVLEAGGTLTRLDGSPLFPFDLRGYAGGKTPFVAAGPAAHAELVEELRSHPQAMAVDRG